MVSEMPSKNEKQSVCGPNSDKGGGVMRLKDLTIEDAANMIIERYEEEYCQMDDDRAIAFLIPDVRRLRPELHLAAAYAAQYVFKNRPQGWRTVRNKMYSGNRIMTLSKVILTQMIPSWTRAEMLMSHPRYIELAGLDEMEAELECSGKGLMK